MFYYGRVTVAYNVYKKTYVQIKKRVLQFSFITILALL